MRGVLLAAGASSRAGGAKALFPIDGRTFVEQALEALLEAGAEEVVVVVAPPHGEIIRARLAARARLRIVENPDPAGGMLSSVRVGLAAVLDAPAVVLSLVDHPGVRAATIQRLVTRLAEVGDDDAVVRPCFAGTTGHPIALGRRACRRALEDLDARSLRDVLSRVARLDDLDVDDPAILEDRDGPASATGD